MNVRLEALHQKADNLDGELETARETDAMIEAVMTEKRQKERIGMLDDLAGVEQLVRILPTCMPESDDDFDDVSRFFRKDGFRVWGQS